MPLRLLVALMLLSIAPARGEALRIPLADGTGLRAFLVPGAAGVPPRPIVVALHGCAGIGTGDRPLALSARERDWAARLAALGHPVPARIEVGAMLETPSLAFAPVQFFRMVDFISNGGNDLKQFFFAADRENERVRRRYDTLDTGFLRLIDQIIGRCAATATPLSFCGEDAGRPIEAAVLAALGLRMLSMRPASVGPVKALLRQIDLIRLRAMLDEVLAGPAQTARPAVMDWLAGQTG